MNDTTGFVVISVIWAITITIMSVSGSLSRNGDMNHDGEFTIVDLSILAEEIRNEKSTQ